MGIIGWKEFNQGKERGATEGTKYAYKLITILKQNILRILLILTGVYFVYLALSGGYL